ncbi:pngase family [Diplodia corticola]|uniref:Pngase family n=1 Tax=Diplodia corticola TaxID=236234 RepID=A0A1J9QNB4_9PEZI|nr:pngase family [Diplodia corticola]OJD30390.1 pngase family [Diplodia corticola]
MTTTPTNVFTRFLHRLEEPKDSKSSVEIPNFEDSIGVEYRKIGKLHCWEAKGSVRRRFLVLKDHIKQYLEDHGAAVSAPVIWQVYLIGKSRKKARPAVFFCSREAHARKMIRKQIEDSNILANFADFKTGDCAQPLEFDQLKPLGADDANVSRPSANRNTNCENPTGRLISTQQWRPPGLIQRKCATVGAVFSWDGLLLFTTAAHAFFEHSCMVDFETNGHLGLELSFDEEGGMDSDSSEDEDDTIDFQRPPHDAAIFRESKPCRRNTEDSASDVPGASHTFDANDVVLSSKDGPHPGLDYCLVMLRGQKSGYHEKLPLTHSFCNYHVIQPRMRASDSPRDVSVVAYTGSGNARDGMLSGTPSFMTLPGGQKTQELWLVRLDGSVEEGDCGSIVVNKKTGDLEGHIVAGSPGSGNAYIIPAHGMLQDIRRRLSSRLQIWNQFSNCAPKVPTPAINSEEAVDLAGRYREILSEARKARLSAAPRLPIHNIPISPQRPLDRKSLRFRKFMRSLSENPLRWNNPDLLDKALAYVPLDVLHRQAESECEALRIDAKSYSPARRPILGFQDCVIRALLRWFKRSFFAWVDNPTCSCCGSKTTPLGMAAPRLDEMTGGARQVEAYRCENDCCGNHERFPRYTDPFILLRTRKGRSGEWAQCFSMLCHAIGARVRWVWNAEDHAWTEVYSQHLKRWIHVDAHAESWDEPLTYCEGWGKKLSYCIAFSKDGATDVTRRYVRSQRSAHERRLATEPELLHILDEICTERRKDMPDEQKKRLRREDECEQDELQKFVSRQITQELCKLDVTKVSSACVNEPDADGGRRASTKRWMLTDNVVMG